MKVQSLFSGGPGGWHAACGAALLTALFAVVPFRALGDQPAATNAVTSVADVAIAAARKAQVAQLSAPSA
jgi:hypothetical protein